MRVFFFWPDILCDFVQSKISHFEFFYKESVVEYYLCEIMIAICKGKN